MAELLLLSNSRAPGQAFLEHAADAIRSILGDRARILFVPFASGDPAAYAGLMRKALGSLGIGVAVDSLHEASDPAGAVRAAEAFFAAAATRTACCGRCAASDILDGIGEAFAAGCPTWAPAPGRTWPARPSAPPTTCRSWRYPGCRRSA